jgi:hypothetical protein
VRAAGPVDWSTPRPVTEAMLRAADRRFAFQMDPEWFTYRAVNPGGHRRLCNLPGCVCAEQGR